MKDSSKSFSETPSSCILMASAFSFSVDTGITGSELRDGINFVVYQVDPVFGQNFSGFFQFINADDDNRFFSDAVYGRIKIKNVDLRFGQRLKNGINAACMQRNFRGKNGSDFEVKVKAVQECGGAVRIGLAPSRGRRI